MLKNNDNLENHKLKINVYEPMSNLKLYLDRRIFFVCALLIFITIY